MKYEYHKKRPDMLTIYDVANILGLSYKTIRAYVYQKRIPAPDTDFHRNFMWKPERLEEFIKNYKQVSRKRKQSQYKNGKTYCEELICNLASHE